MNIIPAIDLIDGKCVRLAQGDYQSKSVYAQSPVEMAKAFEGAGLKYLHLVDLDGAAAGSPVNLSVLGEIAKHTNLNIDFSGGVRTQSDVQSVLDSGAEYVTIGSAAVKAPDLVSSWLSEFGREKFILGADVHGRKIAISGWMERTEISISEFIERWSAEGVDRFLCTSIEKDGLLQGPDFELYEELDNQFSECIFIVSGGVSTIEDLHVLKKTGAKSVIIGKALYEGRIALHELETFAC